MKLAGLQKLTLLDYPGELACTVFTQGCNLRCPFCQNPDLVLPELFAAGEASLCEGDGAGSGNTPEGSLLSTDGPLPEETFFDYLERRRGKLSAVVVSGGEPTLHRDLPAFLSRIRDTGYLVKLDTNGLRPEVLQKILEEELVDYVAMDVKNSPGKYALTCGLEQDAEDMAAGPEHFAPAALEKVSAAEGCERAGGLWERAKRSIDLLKESPAAGEFRTTVALGLHTVEDIKEMAVCLAGSRPWYLQQFVAGDNLVGSFSRPDLDLASPSRVDLEAMRAAAMEYVPHTAVRGV